MTLDLKNISPTDLRDFFKSLGWLQSKPAISQGLFILENPKFSKRQLVFPTSPDAPDYQEAIEIALNKISEIQNTPVTKVVSAIGELNDDAIGLRVVNTRNEDNFIPLDYAVSAINATREMLLSSACSVVKPQIHHPRLSRQEALTVVDKTRFRHTEKGSFVINVSTPIRGIEFQGHLFKENLPFVRQTTLGLNQGVAKLIAAIQGDTIQSLLSEQKSSHSPVLSSNLCKAITLFQEEHEGFDLVLDFRWANILPQVDVPRTLRIQKDWFGRIDDVRKELRSSGEQEAEETFMATVEHLAGDIGIDGRRSGDVTLNLYKGDETIRAKVYLNADQYATADKSHMDASSYIKIKGKLLVGNQPRIVTDINLFELA